MPADPVHWLSRPAPVQDLLLCAKHLFVAAMMAGVHPGPSEHDSPGSPPWSREVLGAASAGVITRGCPAVHWHIDFLVALPSAQDLLLCAEHLFVAAMVAWVHPGPAANRQIRRQRGSPLRSREVFRAAKAKRRRHYPWLTRRSLANRRLVAPPPVPDC